MNARLAAERKPATLVDALAVENPELLRFYNSGRLGELVRVFLKRLEISARVQRQEACGE